MTVTKYVLNGTTDSSGDATAETDYDVNGEILGVQIDGHNLTDGANLTLTTVNLDVDGDEKVGELIVNNGDVGNATLDEYHPRTPAQDAAGAAVTYDGTNEIYVPFAVAAPLRATISAGGDTKAFRVWIIVRE